MTRHWNWVKHKSKMMTQTSWGMKKIQRRTDMKKIQRSWGMKTRISWDMRIIQRMRDMRRMRMSQLGNQNENEETKLKSFHQSVYDWHDWNEKSGD